MSKIEDYEVIGVLGLHRMSQDEHIATIEVDGDFEVLAPEIMCPAIETYIAILGKMLVYYESMCFANSEGDLLPDTKEMN
jgi:hypothetical protein